MTSTNDSRRLPSRVLLFPSCDRDGRLLRAITQRDDEAGVRADALLFGWMLGLDADVDAVGAARAVLAVAAQQPYPSASDRRRALVDGLERFVADRGRIASLSSTSSSGSVRPRRRWRERRDENVAPTGSPDRSADREDGSSGGRRRTRR